MRFLKPLLLVAALALAVTASLGACATQEIPYSTLEARYGLPASRHAELEPGLRVHYTDEGNPSGPILVLVHGFAASVHAWRPWIERLREDYRLIALDLPGHGLTEAPKGYVASTAGNVALVDGLATRLGLERFALAGNSMGGGVAWNYALEHPSRLRGLILVNAAGWPGEADDGEGPPLVFGLLSNPVGRAILKSFNPRVFAGGGLRSAYLDESLVDVALIDRYAELALAPGHRDVLLMARNRPASPVTPDTFKAIATPTLVMAGGQDKIIPVDQQRSLAAAIPGAQLVEYADGGHVPMEQLPDKSAHDLRAFLEGLAP
ncbi:MAG: alpha/beta hydrolase [Alphaproteobacteria bacterium]|nr:alpha/beta hydrolase [Alphaproteobacteria bacterium]